MRVRPSGASLVIAACALAALLPAYVRSVAQSGATDFSAFWCAGRAVLQGADPYLDSSLHACETGAGLVPALTIPVPYPPYAMLLFAATAVFPQRLSFALWSVLLAAATALGERSVQAD